MSRSSRALLLGSIAFSGPFSCMDQQQARDAAREMAEKAKPTMAKGTAVVVDPTKAMVTDATASGELSESSRTWLAAAAGKGQGIEGLVTRGTQLAPVALEIAKVLDGAVDKDFAVEPIYQPLADEAAQKELDEKLAQMPKTQEIDGVSVGFKQLTEVSSEKKVDEAAYLVLWRRDYHLVGFIYRSRREIDLDTLAAETPRLIGLVDGALKEHD